jgi:steroid delta-isomerase-like uncharacterized protein
MSATAGLLDPSFVTDFAHRWIDAWNRRDPERLAELCTPDVAFADPAIGEVHGREAVAAWVEACARAFPDYSFEETEPPYIATDRPKVIAPWRMRGTFTGAIDAPRFAATGRNFVLDGVDHWWFRGTLIERYRADYDSLGLMRQLGIVPPRGSREERTMAAVQRGRVRVARR